MLTNIVAFLQEILGVDSTVASKMVSLMSNEQISAAMEKIDFIMDDEQSVDDEDDSEDCKCEDPFDCQCGKGVNNDHNLNNYFNHHDVDEWDRESSIKNSKLKYDDMPIVANPKQYIPVSEKASFKNFILK